MTSPDETTRRCLAGCRGIVFDLDGTLIDSYAAIAESLNHALVTLGHAPAPIEQVRGMVGRGLEVLIERALTRAGAPDPAGTVADGVRLFRRHYDGICVDRTRLLPGVGSTVAALHARRYRMSVATNKPSYFARRLLDALSLGPYLDTVLGPDLVSRPKPDPEMVRIALATMGVDAGEAVYVGDMEIDVETARAAGLRVIVMPTGSASLEDLRGAGADVVIETFPALLELLPAID